MAKSLIENVLKRSKILWRWLPEYESGNRLPRTQLLSYKDVSHIFEKEIQSPFQNGVTHLCSSKIDQMPVDFSRHTLAATHSISGVRGAPQEIGWHLVNF